ncbi:MAG: SHOCT domain-containing protein, partial [Hyphomicrobium sp.]
RAVSAGYGSQAQFNHYEFGGMGQWSSGGMVMIGDMFNNNLKGRVSALAQDLSGLVQNQTMFARPAQTQSQNQSGSWQNTTGQAQYQGGGGQQQSPGGYGSGSSLFIPGTGSADWWPADLGAAGSIGSQNNLRYAYFPGARRLAINNNGNVTVYDTGDNQIGGFSQQQGGDQSLTFTSQFGLVRVADLPVAGANGMSPAGGSAAAAHVAQSAPQQSSAPFPPPGASLTAKTGTPAPNAAPDEIFGLIEKLAELHKKGILTDAEYEAKKAELLGRL